MSSNSNSKYQLTSELQAYRQMLQFIHGLATVKQADKSAIVSLKPEIKERMETLAREVIEVLQKQPDLTELFLPQELTLQNRNLEVHLQS